MDEITKLEQLDKELCGACFERQGRTGAEALLAEPETWRKHLAITDRIFNLRNPGHAATGANMIAIEDLFASDIFND
jgi:hypothetical protein